MATAKSRINAHISKLETAVSHLTCQTPSASVHPVLNRHHYLKTKQGDIAKIELPTYELSIIIFNLNNLEEHLRLPKFTKMNLRTDGMNPLKGKTIHFDDRYLHVELEDGRIISSPMTGYNELQHASLNQLSNYQLICHGSGIESPALDYHLSDDCQFAQKNSWM